MSEGAGDSFVVIVDVSKLLPRLGCRGTVPVEVVPFGAAHTLALIRRVLDGLPGFHAGLRWLVSALRRRRCLSSRITTSTSSVEMFFEDGIRGDLHEISDQLLKDQRRRRARHVPRHGYHRHRCNKDGTVTILNKK